MNRLEPRLWQSEAAARWRSAGDRGVVSVVTGGGKTYFALHLFETLREQDPSLRLLVIVPSLALLDQWAVTAKSSLGLSDEDVALYSGETFARKAAAVNIAVINTARSRDLPLTDGNLFLVVDECHRAGAPLSAMSLRFPARATLGLSATPRREFDDGFEEFVEPILGPVIYDYDYARARRDGVIVDFTLHNFRVPEAVDVPERESPYRIATGSRIVEQFSGRRIVFTERIDAADRMVSLINVRRGRAAAYHSHLGPSIRRRNLELFRAGQFDTLVTCRALDEGIDVPIANVAVISASTRSLRQRIQRVGRVLRLAPQKPNADVVTLFSTDEERERLESESANLDEVADIRWYEVRGG